VVILKKGARAIMKCYKKSCKYETDKRCRQCRVPICDEHSDFVQLWFAAEAVRTCYPCQSKENLLTMPRKGLKLNEILKNCLWALDSRYPKSVVGINKAVPGHQDFWADACGPVGMLELLQIHAPQALDAPAYLMIDAQECSICLLVRSQEIPAFWISCGV
jgi:hypothetical protein